MIFALFRFRFKHHKILDIKYSHVSFTVSSSGSHSLVMPRLLAHEFGHLLGSDHDGDVAKYVCCC